MNPYEIIGKVVVFGVGSLIGLILLGFIIYQTRCAYFSYKMTKWLIEQELDYNPYKKITFIQKFKCWIDHFDAEYIHVTAKNGAVWKGRLYGR